MKTRMDVLDRLEWIAKQTGKLQRLTIWPDNAREILDKLHDMKGRGLGYMWQRDLQDKRIKALEESLRLRDTEILTLAARLAGVMSMRCVTSEPKRVAELEVQVKHFQSQLDYSKGCRDRQYKSLESYQAELMEKTKLIEDLRAYEKIVTRQRDQARNARDTISLGVDEMIREHKAEVCGLRDKYEARGVALKFVTERAENAQSDLKGERKRVMALRIDLDPRVCLLEDELTEKRKQVEDLKASRFTIARQRDRARHELMEVSSSLDKMVREDVDAFAAGRMEAARGTASLRKKVEGLEAELDDERTAFKRLSRHACRMEVDCDTACANQARHAQNALDLLRQCDQNGISLRQKDNELDAMRITIYSQGQEISRLHGKICYYSGGFGKGS